LYYLFLFVMVGKRSAEHVPMAKILYGVCVFVNFYAPQI
jgi:hypothetical protein